MGSELGEVRGLDLEVWGFGSRVQGCGFRLSLGLTLRKVNPPETTVPRSVSSTQLSAVAS
jgi:hypothetical protein